MKEHFKKTSSIDKALEYRIRAHRDWDAPRRIYWVVENDNGSLRLREIDDELAYLLHATTSNNQGASSPRFQLELLYKVLRSGVEEEVFDNKKENSFVGIALLTNAWGNDDPKLIREGRRFADVPGSFELVNAAWALCDGTFGIHMRKRVETKISTAKMSGPLKDVVVNIAQLLCHH